MKTSMILLALIVLNTSALLSEQLAALVSGINTWLLIGLEVVLLFTFYMNKQMKDLGDLSNIDLSGIELFVVDSEGKPQGEFNKK